MPIPSKGPSLDDVMARMASKPESADSDFGMAYVLVKHFIRIFAIIPSVLFLRRRFGERYIYAFHVVASWGVVAVFAIGSRFGDYRPQWLRVSQQQENSGAVVGFALLAAYSIMLAWHYLQILRRRWADDFSVHSYSEGAPWAIWQKLGLSPSLVGMVIEPILIVIAGYVLGDVFKVFGLGLLAWIVAVAHFVEQQLIAAAVRAKLLDAADALIERRMAEADLQIVRGGGPAASSLPQTSLELGDQAALRDDLQKVRAAAAASYSPSGGTPSS